MAKNTKNGTAEPTTKIDTSAYTEEEAIGFPPYWNPSEGAEVIAVPAHFDDTDPKFKRWIFQAAHDLLCHRGPKDEDGNAEEVPVKKGDFFSTSDYAQFSKMSQYIGLPILLYVKGKRKLPNGNSLWEVGCRVSKETKAILNARRTNAVQSLGGSPAHNTLPADAES